MISGSAAVQFYLGREASVEEPPNWPEIQREGLLGFALEHCRARGLAVPEDIRLLWLRSLAFEMRCRQVLEQISELRVPVLVFKGCSLTFHLYPRPGLRACGDIDLAARPEHWPALRSGLEKLEFQEIARGQFHRGVVGVDLHEHPLHQLTELIGPKSREWWRDARPLWEDRPFLRRLSLEHEFILTLLHASKHAFSRAGWVVDVALLAQRADPDSLAEAVTHYRARRQLAYAKHCLNNWFEWNFPTQLQAVAWTRLTRLEKRFLKVVLERRAPDFLGMLTPLGSADNPYRALRYLLRSLYPTNARFWQRSRELLGMADTWRKLVASSES